MCGIVGFYNVSNAAGRAILALQALQHRGDAGAGVVTTDGKSIFDVRELGTVQLVFSEIDIGKRLPGRSALGHNRYPTSGAAQNKRCLQPLIDDSATLPMVIAHNGNIPDAADLRMELEKDGAVFDSPSDTALFLHLAKRAQSDDMITRLKYCFEKVQGAYSLLVMTPNGMYAAVDPNGIHPLLMAPFEDGMMLASETVAFDLFQIDPRVIRVVEPGTIVDVGNGVTHKFAEAIHRHCPFEFGYFMRPDSDWGMSVSAVRERMGILLAKSYPANADVVISVPDSSNTQASAYAREMGIPFGHGLVRSHYFARTFTAGEEGRIIKVRLKYNPDRSVVCGKRVVIVDDSIVRGHTMKRVVALVRGAGATEVHVRSAMPPIVHPCWLGMDMQTFEELVAVGKSVEQIRQEIDADSLGYLSVGDLGKALNDEGLVRHCQMCFTGLSPYANIRRVKK